MEFLVSHGRALNSEEVKQLDIHAAFEQKQEPESAFMKVLTTIISEATVLVHIQCIPLRSAVLMIIHLSECYCSVSVGVTHCLAVTHFSNQV